MPINLYSSDGHNKLGGRISKNVAKTATNWLKISRAATFGQSLGGHNLVIFYPILTFDHTKMISSSRRVQWWNDLSSTSFRSDFVFLSHFLPPVATWATLGARTQKYPQAWVQKIYFFSSRDFFCSLVPFFFVTVRTFVTVHPFARGPSRSP